MYVRNVKKDNGQSMDIKTIAVVMFIVFNDENQKCQCYFL